VLWADPDAFHVGVEFADVAAEAAATLLKVKTTAKDDAAQPDAPAQPAME
jgi:hypothetical protein